MALAVEQSIMSTRAQYVNPFHVERGGILSLAIMSGISYAIYEPNPTSRTVPVGLMMHDQEEVDLYRAVAPWRTRRAYPEFTPFPYLVEGMVITNAVHPLIDPSTVMPGAPFYLAPSGLITSTTQYSNRKLGSFASFLNDPSLRVPHLNSPSAMRVAGHQAIVNPDPIIVPTAGWVRINLCI